MPQELSTNSKTKKLITHLPEQINDAELEQRVKLRHNIVYSTIHGDAQETYQLTKGVPQGNPNAPILFNIAYSIYSKEIDTVRQGIKQHMTFSVPTWIHQLQKPNIPTHIQLHKHLYIDDHIELHPITQPLQAIPIIQPILDLSLIHI